MDRRRIVRLHVFGCASGKETQAYSGASITADRRDDPDRADATFKVNSGKDKAGWSRQHTVCCILMHSSLVVTPKGLPLGLGAVKFWSRKRFKRTNALKKKVNSTRVPIDEKEISASCSVLGGSRTHLLVRTCVDRLAGDGTHTQPRKKWTKVYVKGLHRVEVRDKKGNASEALLPTSGLEDYLVQTLPS